MIWHGMTQLYEYDMNICFKKKLDLYLSTIPDSPNIPNLSNSLDNKYKL